MLGCVRSTYHDNFARRAIADLEYLEIASDRQTEIYGGYRELPLDLSHWVYLSE
ncbi:hypothetical protein [Microseira sp. BLCC-F43]|uniref:hypothetical protein n=1 Tax=Microseira sp. BLCC-F43 TaxID=3153602 RepID=UPI0035BA9A35